MFDQYADLTPSLLANTLTYILHYDETFWHFGDLTRRHVARVRIVFTILQLTRPGYEPAAVTRVFTSLSVDAQVV